MKTPAQVRIAKLFKAYWQKIMDCWETYNFIIYSIEKSNQSLKAETFGTFTLDHLPNTLLNNNKARHYNKNSVLGITDRILRKVNPQRALIEPVSLTEHFLQDLTEIVYKDFPYRLKGKALNSNTESDKQQEKLLEIIIESDDKEEILDRIIEEKIRSIFYGNPLDFFTKDKANIGLNNLFSSNYTISLSLLLEIIARRNIFVHYNGRVDRKYLREIKNSPYKLDEIPPLDSNYIRELIFILRGFSALATKAVIENTYGIPCTDKRINDCCTTFNKFFKK
jgi:hypothetical protein